MGAALETASVFYGGFEAGRTLTLDMMMLRGSAKKCSKLNGRGNITWAMSDWHLSVSLKVQFNALHNVVRHGLT